MTMQKTLLTASLETKFNNTRGIDHGVYAVTYPL